MIDGFTANYVREALRQSGGNISQAARQAGLSRVAVQNMLARFGIDPDEFRQP
jgi:DNA-binding NtrC family response regulator